MNFPRVRIIERNCDDFFGLPLTHKIDLLLDALPQPPIAPKPITSAHTLLDEPSGTRPGDAFNEARTAEEVAIDAGFELHHEDGAGRHYTRPGKNTRDGSSATVYANDERRIHVFSDGIEGVEPGTYSAFSLFTALHHNGNPSAAARSLAGEATEEQSPPVAAVRYLPEDFWQARPTFEHIRTAARSLQIGPDALLFSTLGVLSASTDWRLVLPAVSGRIGSLNTCVCLVGESGDGKGSTLEAAERLLRFDQRIDNAGDFGRRAIGSGEGIYTSYFDITPQPGKSHKIELTRRHMLFTANEAEVLKDFAARSGSTTLPVLRQAWSGEELGVANATKERNLTLRPRSYRFAFISAIQPRLGQFLLSGEDAGTTQRFLWCSMLDPGAPTDEASIDALPAWPGPLNWTHPALVTGLDKRDNIDMAVEPSIRRHIRGQRGVRLNPATRDTAELASGHEALVTLKAAALLAVLDGRTNVTKEDWRLARMILVVSRATLASMAHAVSERAREQETHARRTHVERSDATAVGDLARLDATERVARVLARRLARAGRVCTMRDLSAALNSRDRKYLADAVQWACDRGWIKGVEGAFITGNYDANAD